MADEDLIARRFSRRIAGPGLAGAGQQFTGARLRDGSYSPTQIWSMMSESMWRADWRAEAERDESFYDGEQHTTDTLKRMVELALPPHTMNLTASTVDSVLGFEALARRSPMLWPENDESIAGVEALNVKFKEALRLSEYDLAYGEAFKDLCVAGIGCVGIGYSADVREYPYAARHVPWREVGYDHLARDRYMRDARWMSRARWFDMDVIKSMLPGVNALPDGISGWQPTPGSWGYFDHYLGRHDQYLRLDLVDGIGGLPRTSLEEYEWYDRTRNRGRLWEVLYRVPVRVRVLAFPDGRRVDFNPDNPQHIQTLARREAEMIEGPSIQARQAHYLGPFRVQDRALPANRWHYVLMFAKRKGGSQAPYGLVRPIVSMQTALNAQLTRILADLSTRRVIVRKGTVTDKRGLADEVAAVDGVIEIERDAPPLQDSIQIDEGLQNTQVHFHLFEQFKGAIDEVTGISPEFKGIAASKRSGVAIDGLIDQTAQGISRIYENYEHGRLEGGRLLRAMIVHDMRRFRNLQVAVTGSETTHRRFVTLNELRGDGLMTNDVVNLSMRTALADAPQSSSYKEQLFLQLSEVMKSLPPELQPLMIDLVFRNLPIEGVDEFLQRLKARTGFGPPARDPEEAQRQAQEMARRQREQEEARQIGIADATADIEKKRADARLADARARHTAGAVTEETEAKVVKTLAEAMAKDREFGLALAQLDLDGTGVRAELLTAAARLATEDRQAAERRQPAKAS